MDNQNIMAASLADAISSGVAWSPDFHQRFLEAATRGTLNAAVTRFRKDCDLALLEPSRQEEGKSQTQTDAKGRTRISAHTLRNVLMCCEEDEARRQCKPDNSNDDYEIPRSSQITKASEWDELHDTTIVARFGVKIEQAYVDGYLDLSGFVFKRPLTFSGCYFTHSVNLANTRLGRVSFERSEFESAPTNKDAALERYPDHEKRLDRTITLIGSLAEIMKVTQGIYAPGATFDGGISLTRIVAQRLDFGSARATSIIDLAFAHIELPHLSRMRGFEGFNDNQDYTAVNLGGSSAQLLRLLDTTIKGTLNLTEARLERLYVYGSLIAAHARYRGNRDIAINAKALHVNSDVSFDHLYPQHSKRKSSTRRTEVFGRVFFDSAKIGGNFDMHGVKIALELNDNFRAELVKRGETTFNERQATRALSLRNSKIGGWLKLSRHEPTLDERDQSLSHEDKFECDGEIDLRSLVVEDDLRLEGCMILNRARSTVIDLREAKIEGTLLLKEFDPASAGNIDLRDTYAKVYRDDFNYASGVRPRINRAWNNFLWYPAGHAIARILSLLLAVATLGLFPLTAGRALPSKERHRTWPLKLKFLLSGFVYDTFPIRGSEGSKDNSDSSTVAISREARVRWLRHQPNKSLTDRFQPQPWTQCASVLRQMGYYRQAHIIEIKREKEALRSENIGMLSKIFRWPLILVCGHGHEMWRLAIVAAVVFVPGLFFNEIAISTNLMRPTNAELLVDGHYREAEYVPHDYSVLRALPFTIKRLLAPPPMASSNEWAPCSGQQIQRAVSEGFIGACIPSKCSIAHATIDLQAHDRSNEMMPFYTCDKLPTVLVVGTLNDVPVSARGFAQKCDVGRSLRECYDRAFEGSEISAVKYAYRADDITDYETQKKNFSPADLRGRVYAKVFEEARNDRFLFWTIGSVALRIKVLVERLCLGPTCGWMQAGFDTNEFLLNGGLTRWNVGLAVTGWGILVILGVFATGLLKRKE